MQDLTFLVGEDRAAAEIWETLGAAGITMQAACTFPRMDSRVVHVTVTDEDAPVALEAAKTAGFTPVDQREVLIIDIEVKPGELGGIARRIANAGAKVYILYMATGNRVVIGADDLDKAAAAVA